MTKDQALIIARSLISSVAGQIDLFAFDESMDLINETERDKILDALQEECAKLYDKANEKKLRVYGGSEINCSSTRNVILTTLYE